MSAGLALGCGESEDRQFAESADTEAVAWGDDSTSSGVEPPEPALPPHNGPTMTLEEPAEKSPVEGIQPGMEERCTDGAKDPLVLMMEWEAMPGGQDTSKSISGSEVAASMKLSEAPGDLGALEVVVTAIVDNGRDPAITYEVYAGPMVVDKEIALAVDLKSVGVWSTAMEYAGALEFSVGVVDTQSGSVVARQNLGPVYFFGETANTVLTGPETLRDSFDSGWPGHPLPAEFAGSVTRVTGQAKVIASPPPTEDDLDQLKDEQLEVEVQP